MHTNRGWMWAFKKARSWRCPRLQSAALATRYLLNGDSGNFSTRTGAVYRLRY